MSTQTVLTLSSTISAIQTLFTESGYAQKMVDILLNAGKTNLSDPEALAQLQEAYQFFEALKNGQKFTDPATGKVMDFSIYGAGGIFGSKGPQLEKLVDATLQSIDTITIPSPLGGNAVVNYEGRPATLFDIVAHPDAQFTFTFNNSNINYTNVSWCNDPTGFFCGLGNLLGGSADQTFNTTNGQIQVYESQTSIFEGSVSTFTCTADLGALGDCASLSSSNLALLAQNAAALDQLLAQEM